ncbi:superoxide dismutase [Paraflavisolibacter sp. H34]|uniref:superoxide dismutase n=1 Tax=Huijunlia imazamoxiresistens TaxID=3127457 RepID=UPI00301B0E60
MAPLTSRRQFLFQSAKAGLGVCIGSSVLSSCFLTSRMGTGKYRTFFEQQPLPYAYGSLSEAIDGTTMEIHYTKHAAGYALNLQDAARNENVDRNEPLEKVLNRISKYTTKMRNNAGGHYNHELFWKCMDPNGGGRPSGKLAAALDESFNTFDSFKTQFTEAGKNRFGSGWAWLILDRDKKLRIGSTPNQDNPLMDVSEFKGFPLLGLDVWEHAYYLRYQNKRPDYIANWWKVVNWKYVQERYETAI